ncbi:UbiH/UbiF/VisC/COQ6 family ubiquinone biosynthesis hydroxylase [Motiliproteus sp. MSK22-1]|uniref:UbiH/UbiF/VisC/COQ6 family ubiquinone biosynthesis hydroxylase n=1 Tax=Motiliproteus sp. MSK22-1 TaxID=1897630 RepID=UPI0009765635|nr:UbiH/UbiF/VisC/COQ6 family ubiquinone biosynthesis hydroxylase [Motiliproteus sp. MSK22-1]OMH32754.1 2-octaprenyl-3-methyl-6-methoxy-1,4-benzoquinol hydroxylase [Motiliproteus sp. MSK22-1]
MEKDLAFDLIIVGAGMVGATLACALAESSLRVAVIESERPTDFKSDQAHDLRVSALNIASQRIFQNIGAWGGIKSRRYCPYRRMRVWEIEGQGDTTFDCKDINESVLGHIVENRVVQLALWERMVQCPNVTLFCPASIKDVDYGTDGSVLFMDDGSQITGRLLVAADGGNSLVRQSAGIGVQSWGYEQQALVSYVETAYPQQDITWQKFVPDGPLAFLPLSGNHASLVWYNWPEEVSRLKGLSDQAFAAELYSIFPRDLGEINQVISRASFPLKRQHALQYVKQGVALVGDAAHMIHPLAGQGVNIGLLDAAVLAETLLLAEREHQNIADISVLKNYESKRRKHNLTMMTSMDLLYRVFRQEQLPVKLLRNLGLGLAQRLAPAKLKAMEFAMGLERSRLDQLVLGGGLPQLAKSKTQAVR